MRCTRGDKQRTQHTMEYGIKVETKEVHRPRIETCVWKAILENQAGSRIHIWLRASACMCVCVCLCNISFVTLMHGKHRGTGTPLVA